MATDQNRTGNLIELAGVFLKLGTTAFGGPAAHIAMMEQEFVQKRQWLSRDDFLDLLGMASMIPGPSSTELAIFIGYRRAGLPGLILGGVCFILPAMLIVTLIAWLYVKFGALPNVAGMFYCIKPVIIAIVIQALYGLARSAMKTRSLALLVIFGTVLCFLEVNQLAILFGAGGIMAAGSWFSQIRERNRKSPDTGTGSIQGIMLASGAVGTVAVKTVPFALWPLFLFFLKIGSILFGSGYVLLAFLRADLVERWHWLSAGQLLDAIAVGQITPGPVFTTATFIGYLLAGTKGALVATIGIFLPSFVLVAISGPIMVRLRQWKATSAFLDGVNAASLSLMAVVTWQLGREALIDPLTMLLAVVSSAALLRYKLNSAWLVIGGATLGLVLPHIFR